MQTTFGTRLLIAKSDISQTHLDTCPVPAAADISPGQILLAVDRVALTANNITYAAAGDAFGYWNFFPAPDGFGIVPMWGFATVVASRVDAVLEGERFYGYWPLATHLLCNSAELTPAGFFDPSPHRQALGPFYNRYLRTSADPGYTAQSEDLQCLFRPLFTTAFLIDRFLAEKNFFGASQILLSSASAKTAFATAFLLHQTSRQMKIIGLTSPHNQAFVESLGSYDRVIPYGDIAALDASAPTVFLDFAGNRDLVRDIHHHFTQALKHSATIGMTHWQDRAAAQAPLPGIQPELFFAPAVAEAQIKASGPAAFAKASGSAWASFMPHAQKHLQIDVHSGMAAAQIQFADMAAGKTAAAAGLILKLQG